MIGIISPRILFSEEGEGGEGAASLNKLHAAAS